MKTVVTSVSGGGKVRSVGAQLLDDGGGALLGDLKGDDGGSLGGLVAALGVLCFYV